MDEARLKEMADTVTELIRLNRDIWAFLPLLQAHLQGRVAPNSRERRCPTEPASERCISGGVRPGRGQPLLAALSAATAWAAAFCA